MKRMFLIFGLLLRASQLLAQEQNLQYYYSQASEAHKAGDHQRFYEMIVKANELHPYHQGILYQRGIAAALTNRPEEAIQFLHQAVLINAAYKLDIEELNSLSGEKSFESLRKLQLELQNSIAQSDTAFVVKDRTLHIETVASGEKPGVFYLSSIHKRKIVKVDATGKVTDFTKAAQDEMTSVLGIKVDKSKKVLWACSSPMPEMENYDTLSSSYVYKYDLKSGSLLAKYKPEVMAKGFVFGDLVLNKKGEVFISDTQNNTIFKVNESTKKLESLFTSDEFWNIQGITFSEDEKYIFISDYIKGVFRLDMESKKLISLTKEVDASLKSIDGLIWYQNSLIAIQNGVAPMRVTRYFLNQTLDTITRFEIIDRGHPAFNEPTNGCIVGNALYYVANSQWGGYDDNHQIKSDEQLQDIVILKADLSKIK